ncbi:ABC transporter permease [Candidatus Chloroploca asiatica]|uniref:Iron ABC transporter permease n=1 Tax=Candidatus Chloroploca asiatica TaxID=1506545 RepID=A0A2H3KLD9_9CHLR|nr:iron ABC transporter permease [Candidatus Chloroploca asiatica]PDV98820.1 iron ABC transporter permease [Candidatus Chloroploca asiatica]
MLLRRLPHWSTILLWGGALLVVAGLLLPTAYLLIRAFETSEAALQTFMRPRTWVIIGNTTGLALAVTTVSGLIAVPIAWLTVRSDLPWRRFWAVVTPLPLVIPSYVGAYLYISALGPRGALQQLLEGPFGITRLPSIYGFTGALFALTLMCYPYMLLSVRAALMRMDPSLEEASRSLGHNATTTFWRVVLPALRPALGAGGLLVALYTLRDFGAVAIMRFDTFTRVIYLQYSSFDRSQAAFFALLLIGLTLVLVAFEAQTRGVARYDQASGAVARPPTIIALGHWRWPAFAFCALIVSLSLVLPLTILFYWLVRGLLAGEQMGNLGSAVWNSLLASGGGAVVTVLAALPLAVLVVRRPGRLTALLERMAYSAFALPGIAVALALVFFGISYARGLYQTFAMLLFAYAILFLPQAFGALRTSLLQIHPGLEESARSLGYRPPQVFLRVTAPLMRPGLIAGASLVFLTAMKELPATLLLAPLGFRSLATEIWSAVSEAFFARAAAPALLIVLLSSVPMALLSMRERRGMS